MLLVESSILLISIIQRFVRMDRLLHGCIGRSSFLAAKRDDLIVFMENDIFISCGT